MSPPSSFPFIHRPGNFQSSVVPWWAREQEGQSGEGCGVGVCVGRLTSKASSHNRACAGNAVRGRTKPRIAARAVGHRDLPRPGHPAKLQPWNAKYIYIHAYIYAHLYRQKDDVVSAKVTPTTSGYQSFHVL